MDWSNPRRPYRIRDERGTKARLYISIDGESVLDDFVARFSRPTTIYRRFLADVLTAVALPADTKAVWSQRAGCSCGCSPAFILDAKPGYDVWATLKGGPEARIDADKTAVAVLRATAIGSDPTITVALAAAAARA
jgi:hypothetical protein